MRIKDERIWSDMPKKNKTPARKLRPTFNSALRGWIQNIPVQDSGVFWHSIGIPLDYSKGFDAQTREQIKAAHNYRRMRKDYFSTKMEVRISTDDCARGYFRLWCKIVMKGMS